MIFLEFLNALPESVYGKKYFSNVNLCLIPCAEGQKGIVFLTGYIYKIYEICIKCHKFYGDYEYQC